MDYRKVYAENEADIAAFAKQNNIDIHNLADRRQLVKDWASATNYTVQKPNWFKQLISNIRIWMHNHGLPVKNLSDDDIANIIYRSAKAARDRRRSASRDGDGVRFAQKGEAVRILREGNKVIPIAEGFNFNKTENMQKAMQDYIALLDGQYFTIKEDDTDVYFDKTSATEYARSNDTKNLRNRHSKLFKAKAKAVAAVGRIVENAVDGKNEPVVPGHSKQHRSGLYRRYNVEFGLLSGTSEIKVYTGELVVWIPEKGKNKFYDITNITFSRKVRDTANAADSTGPHLEDGDAPHQLPANAHNISQNPENASSTDKNGPSAAPDGAMEGKRTDTDKSDGNGALFTLNSNASEELKLQVKAMQACVGPFLDQDGAEYARRFKEKYGITIDPDEAKLIAALAISENKSAHQKQIAADNAVRAWEYFKSFNPLFDFIVEFEP